MIFLVFIPYIFVVIYDLIYLYENGFKKDINIYVCFICFTLIVIILETLGVDILDPMKYLGRFLKMVKDVFMVITGGLYE